MAVPSLAIFTAVLGFNLLGDALRDVLEPRLRGVGTGGEAAFPLTQGPLDGHGSSCAPNTCERLV
jgi:hypothetical protein